MGMDDLTGDGTTSADDYGCGSTPLEFPGPDDRLFACQSGDWWSNAVVVHDRGDRWWVYARGYKEAADLAVDQVNETARSQDFLIYPVLFLYRHCLELMLKGLIFSACNLLGERSEALKGHDLTRWWSRCEHLLRRVGADGTEGVLVNTRRLIGELQAWEGACDAARYPEDLDRLPTLPEGIVNLSHIQRVMDKMFNFLECCHWEIARRLDQRSEALQCQAEQYQTLEPGPGPVA